MRDLWELQYERFQKEDSGLIQTFVTKYMKDNNSAYEDDSDEKNYFWLHGGHFHIH